MANRRLVINSDDQGPFFLLVENGVVTLGGGEKPATVLEQLRVVHIRCELEVEGDQVTARSDEAGQPGTPRTIQLGELLRAGGSQVRLEVANVNTTAEAPAVQPAAPPAPEEPAAPAPPLEMRLRVIDGADQGQTFPLPESGTVTLGKDRKHAEIVLHDLYVARAHCMLEIEGTKVVVVDGGSLNTLVNGKKVTRQEINLGDILRIGNSHLRLEVALPGEEFAKVGGPIAETEEQNVIRVAKEGAAERDSADSDVEIEAVDDSADEADALPDDAPEPVRLLHRWRLKLGELSGQTFGHYRLGPVLGRGRCGVVFRADDTKSGQTLALKVLSPQFPHSDQELQRFARGVKGLLALRHPNLVGLVAAGKNGAYTWVAREYVEGNNLAALLRRQARNNRFELRRACRVTLHVGRALDFARKNNFRHGKVTPANILLQRSDKSVRLADLMLGTVLEGSQLWQAVLAHRPTSELAYLSPEQATPGAYVDELSDLYGLGSVLYALLTGRPPFEGDTAEDILEEVRSTAPVERPTKLNAGIPAPLEKLVLKMLAKRQEDRYQTPADMLADLVPIAEVLGVAL